MADTPKPYRLSPPAPPEQVNKFHELSDVDSGDLAFHHTLGSNPGQAASGSALLAAQNRIDELEANLNDPFYGYQMEASYSTSDGTIANATWSEVGGYNTAFTGFGSQSIRTQSPQVVSYGLGRINGLLDCWIELTAYYEFVNNTTGRRGVKIALDGVDNNGPTNASFFGATLSASPYRLTASYIGPLAAGHYLSLHVYQDSGAALSMQYRQFSFKAKAL